MVVHESMTSDLEKVGYGTVYERELINRLLRRFVRTYKIRSILEYPANDLLGDSLLLYKGVNAYVERSRSIKLRKYDLVWNFCEIEKASDPRKLLIEMIKLSAGYILLIGQNIFNIGVPLHKIYHFLRRIAWDHGDIRFMRLGYVMKLVHNLGLIVLEYGYLDAPIFILDLYECGSLLRRYFMNNLRCRNMLLKESPFERLPKLFKPLFSHHWYLLCKKPTQGRISQNKHLITLQPS